VSSTRELSPRAQEYLEQNPTLDDLEIRKREQLLPFLPEGILVVEELPLVDEMFLDVDIEKLRDEAQMLTESDDGRLMLDVLRISGPIEDATVTDYYPKVVATKAVHDNPTRMRFATKTWLPQEFTHGLVDHLITDFGEGREVSGRDERNMKAESLLSWKYKVASFVTEEIVARFGPEISAVMGSVIGVTNEPYPEFVYMVVADITEMLGCIEIPKILREMSSQEGRHGIGYEKDAIRRLADDPKKFIALRTARWYRRKLVHKIMKDRLRTVGAERRTAEEEVKVTDLFDPSNQKHIDHMNASDARAQKIPGMEDLTPFRSNLLAKGVKLREVEIVEAPDVDETAA